KHNITLPITSTQQLTDIARLLRKDYYFTKILEEWLNITTNKKGKALKTNKSPNLLLPIPNTIEELQTQITNNLIQIQIPITEQINISSTLQTFRQHYTIHSISDYLLKLLLLPNPT